MPRERLPQRRHGIAQEITISGGSTIVATVGFRPDTWHPSELFLSGVKDGTDMAAILDDAGVVISIALQHGITASEMKHSVSPRHASVIGVALELIAGFEEEGPDYRPRAPGLRLVP